MKTRYRAFLTGLAVGGLAAVAARRYRIGKIRTAAWQNQFRPALDVLACPACRGTLEMNLMPGEPDYRCPRCQKVYPVVGGIPHFIQTEELTGWNKRFAGMYDIFSWGYRAFSKLAFAWIGMSEERARREITDRLAPNGGRVLEVSIGPGVNLPYLVNRRDVGEIYGLDISPGQLRRCRDYIAWHGWPVQLQLGNAEQLPYLDNTFAGVFHVGGINFFNDKRKAVEEMIRVARPGARILICDETERGAQVYERIFPMFKQATGGAAREPVRAPVELIPPEMANLQVFEVWKGWFYCIEFTKP